jgi:hypothetical protein
MRSIDSVRAIKDVFLDSSCSNVGKQVEFRSQDMFMLSELHLN